MAFGLQLRILLWKNLTLKRRTPFVLMFELFIPLVLFVILLAIRKKQPAYPVSPNHFHAQPLPSAGIMAILQQFCSTGVVNEYGFQDHPNATVFQFLDNFNTIAQHNNFFDPGFSPQEMDHIPELYRSIIEDPAALHDKFKQAHDFKISTVFSNISLLQQFLSHNFSIPLSDLDVVFRAKVNVSELYNLLFGTLLNAKSLEETDRRRYKRDINSGSSEDLLGEFVDFYQLLEPEDTDDDFVTGLIYKVLSEHGDWQTDPETLAILSSLLGFGSSTQQLDPVKVVDVLRKLVLSPYALHYIACHDDELTNVLVPEKRQDKEKLVDLSRHLCNMSNTEWKEMSNTLQKSLNTEAVIELLDLRNLNLTSARIKVSEFVANLSEFWTFEYNLLNLGKFASKLPQNACRSDQPGNSSDHWSYNTTDAGVTERPEDTTHQPHIEEGSPKRKKHSKYAGLLQIWMAMQSTMCGQPAIPKDNLDKFSQSENLGDLGLTKKQQYDIGILVHVLYSNPKVLYAPNNTAASMIMQRANQSFVLVDRISEYATKWLNVSAQLRHYLLLNSTVKNLESIREMQHQLKRLPFLRHILDNPSVNQFVDNLTTPSQSFFLHQLDVVDNAACSWLALLKGISLNVFQGFSTEEELIDYVLHKAYFDNVTVFASVVFSNLESNDTLPPHVIYKIRQNATFTQSTKFVRPQYWYPGPKAWGYNYYQFGFVWIQDIIERAIINLHSGREVVEPGGYIQQFPYPCFMSDQ